MCTNLLSRALAAAGLTLLLAGCAGLPEAYPPPANPFLTDAAPLRPRRPCRWDPHGQLFYCFAGRPGPEQRQEPVFGCGLRTGPAPGNRLRGRAPLLPAHLARLRE